MEFCCPQLPKYVIKFGFKPKTIVNFSGPLLHIEVKAFGIDVKSFERQVFRFSGAYNITMQIPCPDINEKPKSFKFTLLLTVNIQYHVMTYLVTFVSTVL